MGRLINADELELDTEWSDYYDGFTSYSQSQIDEAEDDALQLVCNIFDNM